MPVKSLLTRLKPYIRWVILGSTLFFISKTLKDHWQDVARIQLTSQALSVIGLAFAITLIAHVWSGWVWHWILNLFGQPLSGFWSTPVYLKTNVAKYLPGNVWHFVGRVSALRAVGAPTGVAVLSVIVEPLLMVVAAVILACVAGGQLTALNGYLFIRMALLFAVVVSVHPRLFNPVLQTLGRAKAKAQKLAFEAEGEAGSVTLLQAYPVRALLGEIGFVWLRSLGFIAIVLAFQPLSFVDMQALLAAFSLAWLIGLVVPGAPGGIGVFEATAISLLETQFPVAVILSSVAIYRLVSVLAEVSAAGIVWMIDPLSASKKPR